jgi:hypothetical protein
MSRANATRDAWHPQTREDREAILLELEQVLASPHFSNSKRYPALLRYIVEGTLAGKSDLLKERTLGVEVFDRPASYDTNADTVVRYTAGEVRKRLSLYYHELDRKPTIQISLPPGSYIPEFLHSQDDPERTLDHPGETLQAEAALETAAQGRELNPHFALATSPVHPAMMSEYPELIHKRAGRRWAWILAAAAVVAILAGIGWRYHNAQPRTALDDFWAPIFHDQRTVLVCTGGAVFAQNNFSGVQTAGRDVEYPFVSFQIASSIAHLSGLVERNGATVQLESSATTPLTTLRERPVILLGGYNNQWSLRLLEPMPIHFAPEANAAIIDTTKPGVQWARDHSLPYSSADDYALVARFRDTTTDNWVVVLAGLGRNGTEAAAQIVTSPHYMQILKDSLGSDFSTKNVEAVVKVNVIEGKTGAPTLLAVRTW